MYNKSAYVRYGAKRWHGFHKSDQHSGLPWWLYLRLEFRFVFTAFLSARPGLKNIMHVSVTFHTLYIVKFSANTFSNDVGLFKFVRVPEKQEENYPFL